MSGGNHLASCLSCANFGFPTAGMSDTPSKDDLDRHAKYQVKDEGRLPTPRELLVGKAREEEIFEDTYGISLYDRRAMQFMEEGTLDNPICILSEEDERIVGISLQVRQRFDFSALPLCHDHCST